MKKITVLLFALVCSAMCWQVNAQCNYTIELSDAYGDGWNGGSISVLVNGGVVLSNVTISGAQEDYASYTFAVESGDDVTTVYSAGSYSDENGYRILNATDAQVFASNWEEWDGPPEDVTTGTITASCPACTQAAVASSTRVDDCDNNQFSVNIDVTSVGDATHISNGANTWAVSGTGVVTVGPFSINSVQTLTLVHSDTDCNLALGSFASVCIPVNDECVGALPISCGDTVTGTNAGATDSGGRPGLDVWYELAGVPALSEITISTCGSNYDTYLYVFDACGTETTVVFNDDATGICSPQSQVTFVATGATYLIRLDAWNAVNIGNYILSVTCLPPPDCEPAVVASSTRVDDCANNQFSVDVDVTTVGDATHITNGTTTWPISGAGVVTVGPFASGSSQALSVVHSDADCNFSLGNFTFACPPANTSCATATSVSCGQTINGTSVGSTGTSEGIGCSMGVNGVWYTFEGTGGDITVSATGQSFDLEMAVAVGSCGTFTNLACRDSAGSTGTETYTIPLSTLGATYYVYIAHYATSGTTTGNFSITVACAEPPECTQATVASSTRVDDCANNQFSVEVDVTSLGDATHISDGTDTWAVSGTGVVTVGPFTVGGGAKTLTLVHSDTVCNLALGTFNLAVCPPANDNFADALPVTCGGTYNGNTTNATSDNQPTTTTFGVSNAASRNVWYSFTGSGDEQLVNLSLCNSSYDTAILVATGTPGNLTWVAGNDDAGTGGACGTNTTRSYTQFTSDGTTTYYIMVRGWNASSYGAYVLDVTCEEVCTPAQTNQDCASALPISVDGSVVSVDNTCSTLNPSQTTCDTFGAINDVWYTFTAPAAGQVNITTELGTATAAHVAVYSGSCGTLTSIGCSAADTGSLSLTTLVPGDTYYLQLWNNASSEEGEFTVTLSDPTLSLDTVDANGFTYFPNPVKNTLQLNAQNAIQNVSVFNMLGQEVLRVTPNNASSNVDMSALQTGAYFVRVTINNTVETVRIIKN